MASGAVLQRLQQRAAQADIILAQLKEQLYHLKGRAGIHWFNLLMCRR